MTVSDLSEAELVARIQSRLASSPPWLTVGIGDDAAVIEPERNRLEVLTTDVQIEGIHFDRRFTPPRAIGHRALAVNLSDLAAMGAAPRLALLSLALPADLPLGDFDALIGGTAALARRTGVTVVGGNLSRSPGPLVVDVTAAGSVKRRRVLTRDGARPGDELFVTGTIGAASLGLRLLSDGAARTLTRTERMCVQRFLHPEPRLRAGVLLGRTRTASACMDLSDGLAAGLRLLGVASGVGVEVEEAALPLPAVPLSARNADPVTDALAGGDDYELLFTVRPRFRGRLKGVVAAAGVPVTRIGVCTGEPGAMLRRTPDAGGSLLSVPDGFSHFPGRSRRTHAGSSDEFHK